MTGDPLGLKDTVIDGKYLVGEAVGEGGAAIVYRAENTVWKIPVAVKVFAALGEAPAAEQPALFEQFIQEGRLISDLSTKCPAIVQARDFGILRLEGRPPLPYLVLEWLDGRSLDEVLVGETRAKRAPRSLDGAMRLLEPVAVALGLAHERGVAHRDIKPENMIVVGDPRGTEAQIKLLDFGIAKVMKRRLEGVHQTGIMPTAFTPYYGAPEQFSRAYGETGPWTDVFALALVLIEVMQGGKRAFEGDDYAELGRQAMDTARRPTPRQLGIPVSDTVEAVFGRALAVQSEQRYADMRAFWAALVGAARPENAAFVPALPPPSQQPTAASQPRPAAPRRSILVVAAALGAVLIAAAAISAGIQAARTAPVPASSSSLAGAPPSAPFAAGAAGAPSPATSVSAAVTVAPCPEGSIVIAGGRFTMGASADVLSAAAPEHLVHLDTFCLDRDEVSVAAYEACVAQGRCPKLPVGSGCRSGGGDQPVNCVGYQEAVAYCTAKAMRLPTEAEWELATTKEGVRALTSGVAEWVADYYASYGAEEQVNPAGPASGSARTVRGGSPTAKVAPALLGRAREGLAPDTRSPAVGFRCARALE
jgi:formylglycine-generating enzyme required for sulfatase activity